MIIKKRRKRRKFYNWQEEISTDWDKLREDVLNRDKNECQFFSGKWNDGIHKTNEIKPVRATMVHHIISIKERPDLALDINNCISLSFEAHEIIEDRKRFRYKKRRNQITKEQW